MKRNTLMTFVLLAASLSLAAVVWAQGREAKHASPRPTAPKFQPHPPGVHPHGPIVRTHTARVMAPRVVEHGVHGWGHWEHPEFDRPFYYWEWSTVRHVSCIAEDSYGDQYPVTEAASPGFGFESMTAVEDHALDRCYAESVHDHTCYLATCSHF